MKRNCHHNYHAIVSSFPSKESLPKLFEEQPLGVDLNIQSEYGKYRPEKPLHLDHSYRFKLKDFKYQGKFKNIYTRIHKKTWYWLKNECVGFFFNIILDYK